MLVLPQLCILEKVVFLVFFFFLIHFNISKLLFCFLLAGNNIKNEMTLSSTKKL